MTYEVSKFSSPLGDIEISASLRGVARVRFVTWPVRKTRKPLLRRASLFAQEARLQLEEYFAGRRKVFNVPLDFTGSMFEQKVWIALLRVPFGKKISYAELARRVGRPGGAQAIGQAVKHNSIAVIVPCHRIVPVSGLDPNSTSIGGYNGGVKRKAWLLDHEKKQLELFEHNSGTSQKIDMTAVNGFKRIEVQG